LRSSARPSPVQPIGQSIDSDETRPVTDDRAVRIGVAFARQAGGGRSGRLCSACVDVLRVSGAGVTIMSGRNSGPVCSSSELVGRLEDLQFALGEGPCHDAFTSGASVSEPDLALRSQSMWPHYTRRAIDLGARAVFAIPLRLDSDPIGVLTLYQDTIGPLTSNQTADSVVIATVLAYTISSIQATSTAPLLASELSDANAHRAEVHQASGMTAIQLQIDVDAALVRMRAHAYATDQSVAFVAREIVAHRLRLSDDRPIENKD
jgi:hypothetical protein